MNGFTNVVMAGRQRTTCTAKAKLTTHEPAHVFFYKESSTSSSSELNHTIFKSRKLTRFCPKICLVYGLWPLTSWCFAHTRPRGNQRLFPLGSPSRPATFSNSEKVAMGIDPALGFIWNRPRTYSKMLTLPMGRPFPSKASSPSMASSRHFLQRPQVRS